MRQPMARHSQTELSQCAARYPIRIGAATLAAALFCLACGLPAIGADTARFRNLRGTRVWLMGDSITKGWGFGRYDHPSPLCRVQDISQMLMQANVSAYPQVIRLNYDGPSTEENDLKYAADPSLLVKEKIADKTIKRKDWLIYEDAGPNDGSYATYREKLSKIAKEARRAGLKVHFMTMFDYNPGLAFSTYDTPTTDVASKTINDAIRDEAIAQKIEVIDMNRAMDQLQEHLSSAGYGSTCFPDGIHPNVFGNWLMTCVLIRTLDANTTSWKLSEVERHFLHPESGGDVPDMTSAPWNWPKDPTDEQRQELVRTIHALANNGGKAQK